MLTILRLSLVLCVSLALGGCPGDKPLPPAALTPPPAALLLAPEPLDKIPACEAQPACRIKHYAAVRAQYGRLADRTRGLQSYVVTVASK